MTKPHAPLSSFFNIPSIVFLTSIFLSAFLLFMVQPMAGKMLLPLVGGAPSGWIVALAFFQTSLLIGYVTAHWMSKLAPRWHGLSVVVLLSAGLYFLPLGFEASSVVEDTSKAAFNVFVLLATSILIPFVALSSISSTLQRLFHNTGDQDKDPYFLYAVSNFGSFIGLLGYPILIEPMITVKAQTEYWAYGYMALIALVFTSALLTNTTTKVEKHKNIESPPLKTCLYWVALAFVPSSLMVGVTNFATQEIMPIPLFWVLPLALYLVTYILAFSKYNETIQRIALPLHPVAASLIVIFCVFASQFIRIEALFAHLVCFSVIAMASHSQLSSIRPHPKYLTAFYLYLAIGGALGGIFNAFIAPTIFTTLYEYPLVAIFSLMISASFLKQPKSSEFKMMAAGFVGLVLISVAVSFFSLKVGPLPIEVKSIAIFIGLAFIMLISNHVKYAFFLSGAALFMSVMISSIQTSTLEKGRNFFGPHNVKVTQIQHKDKTYNLKTFTHGSTIHGIEVEDHDALKGTAAFSYYFPLKTVFTDTPFSTQEVALLGLGAGTLLCYQAPDRKFTSFEIDADVIHIAKTYFSFIDTCAHPENEIILGDGRLELEKHPKTFDVLIMDAFSSDTVPMHLITQEAFQIYKDKLTPEGIILINISNRYFNLAPPLQKTAAPLGFKAVMKYTNEPDLPPWQYPSAWVILTQTDDTHAWFLSNGWRTVPQKQNTPTWTDDFTYLLSSLHGKGARFDETE